MKNNNISFDNFSDMQTEYKKMIDSIASIDEHKEFTTKTVNSRKFKKYQQKRRNRGKKK